MLAKILNPKLLIALTIFAFFSACEKNNLVDQQADLLNQSALELRDGNSYGGAEGARCAELVFPVTVDFPDGTSTEAADHDALRTLLDDWKANNAGSTERPLIAYPHNVLLADGTVVTVNNDEELQAIFAECQPAGRGGHRKGGPGKGGPKVGGYGGQHCFSPVFPLYLVYPDGSVVEVADAAAMGSLIKEWIANNAGATERPEIQYPFEVELSDGTLVMVEGEEDLIALKETCRRTKQCFELVYPVEYLVPTGEILTVSSHADKCEVLRTWRLDNPDVEGKPELVFPLTVEYTDGTQEEISDKEALHAAKKSCKSGE